MKGDFEGVIFSDKCMVEKFEILRVFGSSEHQKESSTRTILKRLQKGLE